jgi:hypothetical protein
VTFAVAGAYLGSTKTMDGQRQLALFAVFMWSYIRRPDAAQSLDTGVFANWSPALGLGISSAEASEMKGRGRV